MRMHHYPSDLTDDQWALIEPHLPAEADFGRPRKTAMRDVFDAILYILRTGCQWRYLPIDFPPRSTVWRYFDRCDGTGPWTGSMMPPLGRSAPPRSPITPAPPPASTASRSTRPPAASSGAGTTPRTSM